MIALLICSWLFLALTGEDTRVARVQKKYQEMRTLSADFIQTSIRRDFLGNDEEVCQSGTLKVKKPGKLRWDYEKPSKKLYIGNGETLWIYTPDEKKAIRTAWEPQSIALRFLFGVGELTKDFAIRPFSAAEAKALGIGDVKPWLYLSPRDRTSAEASFGDLVIKVNARTDLIEEVWLIDPLGSKTHWIFSDIRLNQDLEEKLFSFTPKRATQIFHY